MAKNMINEEHLLIQFLYQFKIRIYKFFAAFFCRKKVFRDLQEYSYTYNIQYKMHILRIKKLIY